MTQEWLYLIGKALVLLILIGVFGFAAFAVSLTAWRCGHSNPDPDELGLPKPKKWPPPPPPPRNLKGDK